MGSPPAGAAILEELLTSQHRVLAAVTAPDRPSGRGLRPAPTAVKALAEQAGLAVLQPESSRALAPAIAEFEADAVVVAAYGFILQEEVLKTPRLGCVNVHFSLLPRLRGAAPVARAILEGLDVTGVTIMQMDAGLDTGPILSKRAVAIDPTETAGTLEARLAEVGSPLLVETLDGLEAGEVQAIPQDEQAATYAPKIEPSEARLDWSMHAVELKRRIRAFNPRPGAWTTLQGKRLKIFRAEVVDSGTEGEPGSIVNSDDGPAAVTGRGLLRLDVVQGEGKKKMTGRDFARGSRGVLASIFE